MIRALLILALVLLTGTSTPAQHTVLFSMDTDENTWWNGNGLEEVGLLRADEAGAVTPKPGPQYSAGPWLSMAAQWVYLGDADGDGRYADDSTAGPGGDFDVLFVKATGSAPFTARDVYFSKEDVDGFGPGLEDGDVLRFRGPAGALELFLTEAQTLTAIGQSGSGDLDTDALCQSAAGDLFLSFDFSESVGGGTAEDGDLIWIPAAAITYDADGNVAAITSNSALIVATEADMGTFAASSGMRTSVGGTPSFTELTALEIDPAGGTWTSPVTGDVLPDVLFAWGGYSNDGAIVSTAAGGTLTTINGVTMGSTVATTGVHLGMLPDSTGLGGMAGMALIPEQQAPVVVENYPRNLITSVPAFHRIEVAGATPLQVALLLFVLGPTTPGGAVPSAPTRQGELFLNGNGTVFAAGPILVDGDGFGELSILIDSPATAGLNFAFQVLDVSGVLSTPAALQFL